RARAGREPLAGGHGDAPEGGPGGRGAADLVVRRPGRNDTGHPGRSAASSTARPAPRPGHRRLPPARGDGRRAAARGAPPGGRTDLAGPEKTRGRARASRAGALAALPRGREGQAAPTALRSPRVRRHRAGRRRCRLHSPRGRSRAGWADRSRALLPDRSKGAKWPHRVDPSRVPFAADDVRGRRSLAGTAAIRRTGHRRFHQAKAEEVEMRSWDESVLALALRTQAVVLGLLIGRWVAEQEAPQRAVIVHFGDLDELGARMLLLEELARRHRQVSAITCEQLAEVAWEIR